MKILYIFILKKIHFLATLQFMLPNASEAKIYYIHASNNWSVWLWSGLEVCYWAYVICMHFQNIKNGILLPKLIWPTARKNCSSDRERICKKYEITSLNTQYGHSQSKKKLVTNTTAVSKYIPRKPRISINWNPPLSDLTS